MRVDIGQELFDKAAVPLCLVDKDSGKLRVNASFVQTFGYSSEEIPTLAEWWPLAYPDPAYRMWVLATCDDALQKALAGDTDIEPIEYRVTCKSGVVRDMVVFGSPVGDDLLLTFFDVTDRKAAEKERNASLQFFEAMDEVNRAIQGASDPEQTMDDVLDTVLCLLDCDLAYLSCPCDPDAEEWWTPVARTRQRSTLEGGGDTRVPMLPEVAETLRHLLEADGPVAFGPDSPRSLPAGIAGDREVRNLMAMAIRTTGHGPWQFGIARCLHDRPWTGSERRLFEVVGHRLGDALSSLLSHRDLGESREFLDSIVESLPHMIFVKDARTLEFVRFNRAGEELLGYSRDELLGRTDHDLFPDEIADFFTASDRRVLAERRSLDIPEERIRLRNGGERVLHTRKTPLIGKDGEAQYLLGISEDITERKQAAEKILRSDQRLRLHREQSPVGFLEWDEGFRAMEWNAACERIFGYTRKEAIGRHAKELLLPEHMHDLVDGIFESLMNRTGGEHSVNENVTKDGRIILCEWFNTTLVDKNGESIGVASICIDITERRQLEEQLDQARKLESVGQLAGGVAHDFNNMLAVILGRTELALAQVARDHQLHANLLEIRKAAERSADLTRQLLAFARKQVITPKTIDLNDTVEGMLTMLHRVIGEDVDLAWKPDSGVLAVYMDPTQLDQILVNLCVNSRDAVEGAGRITIETGWRALDEDDCAGHADAVPGDFAVLAVRDNGRGMDKATLDRVFEPFFTTKGIGRGTGLGLATVHGIVSQNNGLIRVDSEPGRGTTFEILLPLQKGGAVSDAEESGTPSLAHGNETLLLVEDEPSILSMAGEILEGCGYRVLQAASPSDAIQLARSCEDRIRLLVSDVVMPGMNGPDLRRELTADHPQLQCLYISGHPADVIISHGVGDEGIHFLQKPFSMAALTRKVREALDETPD